MLFGAGPDMPSEPALCDQHSRRPAWLSTGPIRKGEQMPSTKKSKRKLAAGKKQETIKPLKTKVVDAASPNLFFGCATGKHYTGLTK